MERCVPRRGPLRVRAPVAGVEVGAEPVRAPLPDVAGHVVQSVAVGREGVDRAGAVEAVLDTCSRAGRCPARRSCGARRPARARRPTGTPCPRARRARRTPIRPRSAAACRPSRSRPARRSSVTCTTGWSMRPSSSDCGPSGRRQSAPSTWRHHGACATPRVGGKSSGSRPANTNDQPKRSASVTWPVSLDEARRTRAFDTARRSIQNESTRTRRTRPLAVTRVSPGVGVPHHELAAFEQHHPWPE